MGEVLWCKACGALSDDGGGTWIEPGAGES